MKNPEEYLKDFYNGIFYELHSGDVDDIIKYIRKAQIDAYNEALEDVIDNVELIDDDESTRPWHHEPVQMVDRQSILKLKK